MLTSPTDDEGAFELVGADAGSYRVRVSGPGIFAAELSGVDIPGEPLSIAVARKVSIAGVVTERGRPVPGATVELTGDAIGGTVQQKTAGDGRFALPELPEGNYDVVAYRNDLASATQHLTRLGIGPFAEVALPLETAAVVQGRVFERGPDELPGPGVIAAIELRPLGDDEPARYAQSGADGRFRLEGVHRGRWVVSAIAPGYVLPEPVEIDAGRGVVELGVVAGGSIEGRVIDSSGKPVAGAELRAASGAGGAGELSGEREASLLATFGGRSAATTAVWDSQDAARQDPRYVPRGELGLLLGPLPAIPPLGSRAARHAVLDPASLPPELAQLTRPPTFSVPPAATSQWTTDAAGGFRLRGLPPGRYTLRARAPGYAEGQRGGVLLAAGAAVRGVEIELSVGTFLVGTVRSHRGDPVAGAQLVATPVGAAARPGGAAPAIETRSNGDGSYRLGPLLGAVTVAVSADGHASIERRFDAGRVAGSIAAERREDLTLTVHDAALSGTVEDSRGSPLGGARISIAAGPGQGKGTVSAADGSFALTQLPAGPLRLAVEHAELPSYQATAEGAGVRLTVPLGGALEGRLLDEGGNGAGGVRFSATGPAGAAAEGTTAVSGALRLTALRPGAWQLTVRRPGWLPLTRAVTVPAGTARGQVTVRDLVLTLARGGVLGGTVRDGRGSRLAGAAVFARAADGTTAEGRSDANGEFRLRDCPTGDLELSAEHAGARASTRLFLRPGQEILTLGLEIATP